MNVIDSRVADAFLKVWRMLSLLRNYMYAKNEGNKTSCLKGDDPITSAQIPPTPPIVDGW